MELELKWIQKELYKAEILALDWRCLSNGTDVSNLRGEVCEVGT